MTHYEKLWTKNLSSPTVEEKPQLLNFQNLFRLVSQEASQNVTSSTHLYAQSSEVSMDLFELFKAKMFPGYEVFDCIPDGVVLADVSKQFIFWNKAAKEILQNEPADHPPIKWAEAYRLYQLNSKIFLKYEELPMIRALAGEEYSDYRISTRLHPDAPEKILSVNGAPLYQQDQLVGAITTFRDITRSVSLKATIEAERKLYQTILDLLPGIVFIKDQQGTYTYANKNFLQLLQAKDVVGKSTRDYLPPEIAKKIEENDRLVTITGRPHVFKEDILWPDGEKSVFQTIRFPFILSERSSGICAVAMDITDEMEQNKKKEIELAKIHQLSKLATVGMVASEIAHELQNPLTILSTYNKLLKETLSEEVLVNRDDINTQLKTLERTSTRMSTIIKSLNVMSKDAQTQERQLCELGHIISEVHDLCTLKRQSRILQIDYEKPEIASTGLYVNKVQIEEVLLNVIVNALDATESVKFPRINLHVSKGADEIVIKVSDNGPGVPAAIRPRIFESFFTTKDTKGTGLGLSLSQKIMQEHGGTIDYYDNQIEHGFRLVLPLG